MKSGASETECLRQSAQVFWEAAQLFLEPLRQKNSGDVVVVVVVVIVVVAVVIVVVIVVVM